MTSIDFKLQCAISAMQGIQESGHYVGLVSDFIPKELAKKSFDIAEEMYNEAVKRGIQFSDEE